MGKTVVMTIVTIWCIVFVGYTFFTIWGPNKQNDIDAAKDQAYINATKGMDNKPIEEKVMAGAKAMQEAENRVNEEYKHKIEGKWYGVFMLLGGLKMFGALLIAPAGQACEWAMMISGLFVFCIGLFIAFPEVLGALIVLMPLYIVYRVLF